jgi:hypothetical protein
MNWFFIFIGAALILWFFSLLYMQSIIRRRTSPDYILKLLQEEVNQLHADIDEITEQNLQLLEDKIKTLRELCSEAEKRIAVYGRELEKREKEAHALSALNVPLLPEKEQPPEKKDIKHTEKTFPKPRSSVPLIASLEPRDTALEAANAAYRAQTGQSLKEPQPSPQASQTSLNGSPLVPPKIVVSRNITSKTSDKERIAELSRAGFPPEAIAKRLGLPLGEVALYVNVRKKN